MRLIKFCTISALALAVAAPDGAAAWASAPPATAGSGGPEATVHASFPEAEGTAFTGAEQARIIAVLDSTYREVVAVLPGLTQPVEVSVVPISRAIDEVGGVTGRAQAPGQLLIEISTVYPGGVAAAVEAALRPALMHELHHLVRGWTIEDNHFGPGIAVAAINEGLAVVFSEIYSGVVSSANAAPEDVDAWIAEILALPHDADYGEWMFAHPDGRQAIGYRAGSQIIRQTMAESGRTIVELSALSPEEILVLAGLG